MTTKEAMTKRILNWFFLVATVLFLSLFSFSVLAADPGHGAGVIGSADFESGNYSFPDSLIVNYSAYFATSGGNVGIGTTTPTHTLNVVGDINATGRVTTAGLATDVMSRIDPIYIRGSEYGHPVDQGIVRIGNETYANNLGRGLTLVIVSKADHSLISAQKYDTHGSSSDSDSLATSLNENITNVTIGVLVSDDAWITSISANLVTAFKRLGLYKAVAISTSANTRYPYATIFEGASSTKTTARAVEVMYEQDDPSYPYAEIRGWLIDGGFMATRDLPNALTDPIGQVALFVDRSSNVGIGTTAPAQTLNVVGDLNVTGTSYLGSLNLVADNITVNNLIGLNADMTFSNSTSNEVMRITQAGRVGIGTISPSTALHIKSQDPKIVLSTPTSGEDAVIYYNDTGERFVIATDYPNEELQFIMDWATNPGFFFLGSNVGIGTTTPGSTLDVVGSANISSSLDIYNYLAVGIEANVVSNTLGQFYQSFTETSGTAYGIESTRYQGSNDNPTGTIIGIKGYGGKYNTNLSLGIGVQGVANSGGVGTLTTAYALHAQNTNNPSTVVNNYGLYIDSISGATSQNWALYSAGGNSYFGGNIGIGSTSPGNALDVVGNINSTGYINATTDVCIEGGACLSSVTASGEPTQWVNGSGGDIYYNSGSVGIGTASPRSILNIAGNTAPTLTIENTNTGILTDTVLGALNFYGSDSTSGTSDGIRAKIVARSSLGDGSSGQTDLLFFTSPALSGGINVDASLERMRITTSGNVGINTTSPSSLFHVNGPARISGYDTDGQGLLLSQVNNTPYHLILQNTGAASNVDWRFTVPNNGDLDISSSNGLFVVEFEENGAVGINTSSPSGLLHVATGGSGDFVLTSSGRVGIGYASPSNLLYPFSVVTTNSSSQEYKGWFGRSTNNEGLGIAVDDNGAYIRSNQDEVATEAHFLTFEVTSGASGNHYQSWLFNNTEKMKLTANYLGVTGDINSTGYINATTDVCIEGGTCLSTVTVGGEPTQWVNGSGGDIYYNSGEVGIGTSTPLSDLSIIAGSTIYTGLAMYTSDFVEGVSGSSLGMYFGASTGDTYSIINAYTQGFGGSGNLVLNSNGGNVGIGTTNPAEELEVVGTFNVTNGAYISNNLTLDNTLNNATGSPKITFENGDVIITLG